MNPIKVADLFAQHNIREHGRVQQLGNNDHEIRTQDDCEISQSQIGEMNPVQLAAHSAQRNI